MHNLTIHNFSTNRRATRPAKARALAPAAHGDRGDDGQLADAGPQVPVHHQLAVIVRQRDGHHHAARTGPG